MPAVSPGGNHPTIAKHTSQTTSGERLQANIFILICHQAKRKCARQQVPIIVSHPIPTTTVTNRGVVEKMGPKRVAVPLLTL